MPRKNPNTSFYHYMALIRHDQKNSIKYFLTLKDVCTEFNTSTYTIYKMIKHSYKPRNERLRNVSIVAVHSPTHIRIKNETEYNDISPTEYGILDQF